jgi:rfaE bifunctional protein kinase chain/domain
MVTISVPKKRLNPIFLLGFFISPAIKVTLFQESLLKIEPDMAEAIAPIKAMPVMGSQVPASGVFAAGIFVDYNKGVLTERVIKEVTTLCKQHGVITTVDPKRKNFFSYEGVDIFKPNLKEVKDGLNLLIDEVNLPTLNDIHQQLQEKLGHSISFITLSEKGVFYQENSTAKIIPSHLRNIADVSGAGDTVIAVASLIYAATKRIDLMAEVANIAGGLVCEEVGTAAVNKDRLLQECKLLLK